MTTHARTTALRSETHATDDPVHDGWVDLVVAIFRQAKRDLSHPRYRRDTQQWLRSPTAAFYAGLLGVNIEEKS